MQSYTLIRTARKTLALYVRDGHVEVRAPLKVSQRVIDAFVNDKAAWLNDKLAASRLRQSQRAAFALDYGSTLLVLGVEYPIVASASAVGFDGAAMSLPPDLSSEQVMAACANAYRQLAKRALPGRVRHWSATMGVAPTAVKINGAQTRWGSCSAKGNLNFSWRLMMAEPAVIDYVVVHELAHLTQMNHSPRFWAIVQATLPDYRQRQQRLKLLQRKLTVENWNGK